MQFENQQNGNGGILILQNDDAKEVGRLTYTLSAEKLIISYVMVHSEFEGRGMGKFLVEEAIKFAESQQLKIYPHCSYARAVMKRLPENTSFEL